jgi:hypothetical protein
MAAPIGNKNATKSKPWLAALERHSKQNPEALRNIAIKVFEAAEAGEPWAVQEVANRLDGKPVQQLDVAGDLTMNKTYRDLTDDALLAIAAHARAQEVRGDTDTLN